MRILFMGTPEFAVPSLAALQEAGHELVGSFTQPDKPKNRGMKLIPTPVKEFCLAHEIPVFQPEKLRDGKAMEIIKQLNPQLIAVAAYGKLLPEEMLAFPPMGCINVHSSLLPKYRGAAPIQWAILNGEEETGVTLMHMAKELDAGDIIASVSTPIEPDETAQSLHDRLAVLGAKLLVQTVAELEAGRAKRTPQQHEKATFAPMLSREMSPMDWNKPARQLHNQVRGLFPWPAASMQLAEVRCKVFATRVAERMTDRQPGTVLSADQNGIAIACGQGTMLVIDQLQPDGGRPMKAADYLRGHPVVPHTVL